MPGAATPPRLSAGGDRHRADGFHVLAIDCQHGNRILSAVGDQRQCSGAIDRHARSLFAGLDRTDMRGRCHDQVDHVDFVVRHTLPVLAVFHPVERIGDQGQVPVRGDGKIDRRPGDRVHQRQVCDDPRLRWIGDVDDRYGVLARRVADGLAIFVERDLFVVAGDQELRSGGAGWYKQGRGGRAERQQLEERLHDLLPISRVLTPICHASRSSRHDGRLS